MAFVGRRGAAGRDSTAARGGRRHTVRRAARVTAAHAWQVQACGACIYWHNQDIDPSGSVGRCSWPHPDPPHTSSAVQNVLAAPCAHFAVTADETAPPPVVPAVPVVPLADTARPWWQRLWRQQPEAAAHHPDARPVT
ncbi:MAG: hypothetical protein HZY76_06955 [Anaerolineae bacterium]|nr:MAG: hypothetical protein HZY76_06955 [Anaerolineae bacterium]